MLFGGTYGMAPSLQKDNPAAMPGVNQMKVEGFMTYLAALWLLAVLYGTYLEEPLIRLLSRAASCLSRLLCQAS